MIRIRSAPRVDMRHEVQHAVAMHDAPAHFDGNVMTLGNGQACIDLDMGIHQDHVAHLPGADVMHALDAVG